MDKMFRSIAGISLIAIILALLGMLSTPAQASTPMLFVTNMGYNTISRGNLDGTGGVSLGDLAGTLGSPTGIALDEDNNRMYVANCNTSTISAADMDGQNGVDLGNLGGFLSCPVGIAIDPVQDHLYVVNQNNGFVVRANLDGTGATNLGNLGGTLYSPEGLALDLANNKIYVVNYIFGSISRGNLDGTGGVSLGNLNNTLDGPYGIALDLVNNLMYVTNYGNNTISRANLDGTGGVSLGNLGGYLSNPTGIALDIAGNKMYVSNASGTITRANLDGTGGVNLGNFDDTIGNPRLIAISGLGPAPAVEVSPSAWDFGFVGIGTTSPAKHFTLMNSGSADLHVSSLTTSGVWILGNNTCNVATVTPGGTCTFDVAFHPAAQETLTGSITIESDAETSPDSVALIGTGVVLQTLTVRSAGLYDGWILESGENSSQGRLLNSDYFTFNLGDETADRQYRGILSFPTGALPNNAVITKVTLKIRRESPTSFYGTNPFNILGALKVDIKKPFFGSSPNLQEGDFQAAADKPGVASFGTTPVNNWYTAWIGKTGHPFINLTGMTQLRLRFGMGDNDDGGADFMRFFSGDYATVTFRPTLIIKYYVP